MPTKVAGSGGAKRRYVVVRRVYRKAAKRGYGRQTFAGVTSGGPANYGMMVRKGMSLMMTRSIPYPLVHYATFKYSEIPTFSSSNAVNTIGTCALYQINSLHGPHYSGPGVSHQPYEWDQIKALYAEYRVFEVAWEIQFIDSATGAQVAAVQVTPSNSTLYDMNGYLPSTVKERNQGEAVPLNNYAPTRFAGSVKLWELEGRSYNEWLANPAFSATSSASPTAIQVLTVGIADSNSASPATNATAIVTLWFKAKLYSAVTQSAS